MALNMKAIWMSAVFLSLCCMAGAQSLSVQKADGDDEISFVFPSEINIAYYVVAAGNDTSAVEIIGRIGVKGYDIRKHRYEFVSYDKHHRCYVVKQIDMSGVCVAKLLYAEL